MRGHKMEPGVAKSLRFDPPFNFQSPPRPPFPNDSFIFPLTRAGAPLARLEPLALVDLHLAVGALVACVAEAVVHGHAIAAVAVEAGVAQALVDVHLAVGACAGGGDETGCRGTR